jgi:hypothetical protein
MATIRTKYGKTEMRCVNMVATGDTLVVAPNYKNTFTYVILHNQMIAEQIATDKKVRATAYKAIQESYNVNKDFMEFCN